MRILRLSPEKECCLCGTVLRLELHHVYPRGQGGDDVRENLVWLCSAEHALITRNDIAMRRELGRHIAASRPDVEEYVLNKLGFWEGRDWLERRLLMDV